MRRLIPLGRRGAKQQGFTLVELITVVVILAVVAVIGTGFIISSTENYQTTQTRALLVNTGRAALERMTRQLRVALPQGVRITNGGNCVQFLPIAGGGTYLNPVPDQNNGAAASGSINTSVHEVEFGSAEYLSIGALVSNELYGASAVSIAAVTGRSSTQVNFPSKVWERNSLSRRFYLLDNPQAFCLFGGELRFYENLDITSSGVDTSANYDLLARSAQASGSPFELSSGSEDRNINVILRIGFSEGGESVTFDQQVFIRNVP